jgi:LppP/LprE lipoprotein
VLRGVAVSSLAALLVVGSASAGRDPNLAKAKAFVDGQCPRLERSISSDVWMGEWRFNALYGNCRAGDGRDQHVWFFAGGRFVGSDTREPDSSKSIVALWRDGDTIAFLYVLYRRDDPNCCPTGGGKVVRYRLVDGNVRRLDPLPPRQRGGTAIGR